MSIRRVGVFEQSHNDTLTLRVVIERPVSQSAEHNCIEGCIFAQGERVLRPAPRGVRFNASYKLVGHAVERRNTIDLMIRLLATFGGLAICPTDGMQCASHGQVWHLDALCLGHVTQDALFAVHDDARPILREWSLI